MHGSDKRDGESTSGAGPDTSPHTARSSTRRSRRRLCPIFDRCAYLLSGCPYPSIGETKTSHKHQSYHIWKGSACSDDGQDSNNFSLFFHLLTTEYLLGYWIPNPFDSELTGPDPMFFDYLIRISGSLFFSWLGSYVVMWGWMLCSAESGTHDITQESQ